MIQHSYEHLVKIICEQKELAHAEVEQKVEEKLKELQGLISKEGAAHIVANEMGIQLALVGAQSYKLKEVTPGLNQINLDCKVVEIYEVRTFQRGEKTCRVASFVIADETDSLRLVVWDEPIIDQLAELKKSDILRVRNGYARENNRGYREIHLGNKANVLINPEGVNIQELAEQQKPKLKVKKIADVQKNDVIQITGFIVEAFEPRFYTACPDCFKKVTATPEGNMCTQHGQVEAQQVPIVNIILDDGTANIRAVCFRQVAKFLLDQGEDIKTSTLGKHILAAGKVNKNEMFDRLEFVIHAIEEPTPQELLAITVSDDV